MSSFRIHQDVRGYHHGQMDCTLYLLRGDESVGYLDYAEFDRVPHIEMIKVHPRHQRRGYATRLLLDLQSRFPGQEINWGYCTPQGLKLKAAVATHIEPTRHAPAFARLERLRARLAQMETRIADLHAAGEETRDAITAYYCLERHADDLEWRLDGLLPSKLLIKAPEPITTAAAA